MATGEAVLILGHHSSVDSAVEILRRSALGRQAELHLIRFGRSADDSPLPEGAVSIALPSDSAGTVGKGLASFRFLRALRKQRYQEAFIAQPDLRLSRGRGLLIALPFVAGASRVRAIDPATGSATACFRPWFALTDLIRFVLLAAASAGAARVAALVLRYVGKNWTPPQASSLDHASSGTAVYLRTDVELAIAPLEIGGSQSHTDGILGGLVGHGHGVEVWATGAIAGRAQTLPRRPLPALLAGNLPVEAAELASGLLQYWQCRRYAAPSFIYQRYSLNNLAGLLLAAQWGVPLILEANASEMMWRRDWSTLRFPKLAEASERFILGRASRIVAVSENAARDLRLMGAPAARLRVVPNGVEIRRFIDSKPAELPFRGETFVVCFVGLFYPWHGVRVLAEAFGILRSRFPRARLLLVGDGEERPLTRSILEASGTLGSSHFTGLIPHNEVPSYLAAADVLVSPHVPNPDFIGSPVKLWEYMASGRAIVASDVGQLGQALSHEETALKVPPGNPRALAQSLARLHDSPELAERLGRAAKAEASAKHSWDARIQAIFSDER